METCPVLEMYVSGYFSAEKKLQGQQTELLFDAKNKNKPKDLETNAHSICVS